MNSFMQDPLDTSLAKDLLRSEIIDFSEGVLAAGVMSWGHNGGAGRSQGGSTLKAKKCWRCQKPGHLSKDCPEQAEDGSSEEGGAAAA
jgi:hypothetical protein